MKRNREEEAEEYKKAEGQDGHTRRMKRGKRLL